MERTKLKAARLAKGLRERRRLTQATVAVEIGCSEEIYGMWERGECYPQEHYRDKLLEYYGVTDPQELDLVPRAVILSLEEIVALLSPYNSRELLTALQPLPAFAGIDLLSLLDTRVSASLEFLRQCQGSTFIYVQHICTHENVATHSV